MKKLIALIVLSALFSGCETEVETKEKEEQSVLGPAQNYKIETVKSEMTAPEYSENEIVIGSIVITEPDEYRFRACWEYNFSISDVESNTAYTFSFNYMACDANTSGYSAHTATIPFTSDENGKYSLTTILTVYHADWELNSYSGGNVGNTYERMLVHMEPENFRIQKS